MTIGTAAVPPTGARVILGVGGGIAAYKACEVLRGLTESGHRVTVVPTQAALRFVGEATWAALSGEPVAAQLWADTHDVPHVRLGRSADLVVVVPATADLMAKAAHGLADDLLTSTLLTASCPVVFVPAMHTEMWEHPATVANVATLRRRGAVVVEPAVGRLTGADTGKGRLPEPAAVLGLLRRVLARAAGTGSTGSTAADLAGRTVVDPGSRWTRCGSSATGPAGGRDTPWPSRRPRGERASCWSPPTWRCPTPAAWTWSGSARPCSWVTPSGPTLRTRTPW